METSIQCKVTRGLIDRLIASDAKGLADYGNTVDRRDYTPEQWAEHLIGELLDGAKYTVALVREVERLRAAPHRPLADGNACLLCGHVAKPMAKRPLCYVCDQPFTRAKSWRLLRGKRVHVACVPKSTL